MTSLSEYVMDQFSDMSLSDMGILNGLYIPMPLCFTCKYHKYKSKHKLKTVPPKSSYKRLSNKYKRYVPKLSSPHYVRWIAPFNVFAKDVNSY